MEIIGSYKAKTHLSEILKKVAEGTHFIITKNGMPLAKLLPFEGAQKENPQDVIKEIKALRKGKKLKGLSVREMIDQGRR